MLVSYVTTIFCLGRGELLLRNTDLTPILGITLLEERVSRVIPLQWRLSGCCPMPPTWSQLRGVRKLTHVTCYNMFMKIFMIYEEFLFGIWITYEMIMIFLEVWFGNRCCLIFDMKQL